MNNLAKNKTFINIAGPLVIAMFFIADRYLKNLALNLNNLEKYQILGSILEFRLVFNPYIAFSLPLSGIILNILIFSLILALLYLIIYSIIKQKLNLINIYLLTFILFGAISNLLDRFLYGAVIDYFDLKYFTIFNLADLMISLGVLMFFINQKKAHGSSDKMFVPRNGNN